MKLKFYRKWSVGYILINIILILSIILSTSTIAKAAGDEVLPEIRSLLQTQYVDPVSAEVLNAATVDDMLKRLGDPHTIYFSPQQYQDFLGSIDMRFSGIGIHMEMVPSGVKVISVVSGSPAEAVGIKPGDIITRVAGQSLAGLSSETAVSLLRGLEGTTVQISVEQGTVTRDYSVTRRAITEPTVTGGVLNGHIGYLDLNSFGSTTPQEFETAVNRLRSQKVDSWIVDLRDNGGGYISSVLDLAGYFIGPNTAVQIKDRTGTVAQYQALDHGFTLDQPIIFLTNQNSASASELLTAAVKDYQKATIVGTTTYGKGSVQSMFPLSNGGVLKMTIDHFYSPLGHVIDKVGVSPDVAIQHADSLSAAELMLADSTSVLAMGRTAEYWEAWGEVANTVLKSPIQAGDSNYSLYYPGYAKVSELTGIPLDKKFTVHFSGQIDWQSVTNSGIELMNSQTGERVLSTFVPLGGSDVQMIPNSSLSPDTTYWLVIHPTVQDIYGRALKGGALALAHTISQVGVLGASKSQSFGVEERISEGKSPSPSDPDYGSALWDLSNRR